MRTNKWGPTAATVSALLSVGAVGAGCSPSTGDQARPAATEAVTGTSGAPAPAGPGGATAPGPGSSPAGAAGSRASTTTTATATTPTPRQPASSRHCTADRLELTIVDSDNAMSNQYYLVGLTNRGKAACTMTGHPGVSLLDSAGQSLGEAKRDSPGSGSETVTLEPGQGASALLHTTTEVAHEPCGQPLRVSARIEVIPPDDTGRLSAPFTHERCAELDVPFSIDPVKPGIYD